MKKLLLPSVLLFIFASCSKKTEDIIRDRSQIIFAKDEAYIPFGAFIKDATGETYLQSKDWFEREFPQYIATDWNVGPVGTGVYISFEDKFEPNDDDEFLIDESGSFIARLPKIKMDGKPTSGGGVFHNYNDVFLKCVPQNGYWVFEILEHPSDAATESKEEVITTPTENLPTKGAEKRIPHPVVTKQKKHTASWRDDL